MRLIDADKLIDALKTKVESAELDYNLTEGSIENMVARVQIRTLSRVLEAVEAAVVE